MSASTIESKHPGHNYKYFKFAGCVWHEDDFMDFTHELANTMLFASGEPTQVKHYTEISTHEDTIKLLEYIQNNCDRLAAIEEHSYSSADDEVRNYALNNIALVLTEEETQQLQKEHDAFQTHLMAHFAAKKEDTAIKKAQHMRTVSNVNCPKCKSNHIKSEEVSWHCLKCGKYFHK